MKPQMNYILQKLLPLRRKAFCIILIIIGITIRGKSFMPLHSHANFVERRSDENIQGILKNSDSVNISKKAESPPPCNEPQAIRGQIFITDYTVIKGWRDIKNYITVYKKNKAQHLGHKTGSGSHHTRRQHHEKQKTGKEIPISYAYIYSNVEKDLFSRSAGSKYPNCILQIPLFANTAVKTYYLISPVFSAALLFPDFNVVIPYSIKQKGPSRGPPI
ncbi:hypothetical protein [uncultured Chryseobacterium sp.]|uniref:hypothetical protein n=2 Tax=uncultured Chryseobacterium sp. TaxID=259322 RepID=UPI0025D6BBDE|nr:hypothetical protein [uncultured Chryseobacterium sp.]